MSRPYKIGLISFLLALPVSFVISGLLWLVAYSDARFGVALGPITVYSFESLVIYTFIVIFLLVGAGFYFLKK